MSAEVIVPSLIKHTLGRRVSRCIISQDGTHIVYEPLYSTQLIIERLCDNVIVLNTNKGLGNFLFCNNVLYLETGHTQYTVYSLNSDNKWVRYTFYKANNYNYRINTKIIVEYKSGENGSVFRFYKSLLEPMIAEYSSPHCMYLMNVDLSIVNLVFNVTYSEDNINTYLAIQVDALTGIVGRQCLNCENISTSPSGATMLIRGKIIGTANTDSKPFPAYDFSKDCLRALNSVEDPSKIAINASQIDINVSECVWVSDSLIVLRTGGNISQLYDYDQGKFTKNKISYAYAVPGSPWYCYRWEICDYYCVTNSKTNQVVMRIKNGSLNFNGGDYGLYITKDKIYILG